jgi:hypothetical protein
MGRYRNGKATREDCLRLDILDLNRNGYLRPGRAFTLCWSRNEVQTGAIQGSKARMPARALLTTASAGTASYGRNLNKRRLAHAGFEVAFVDPS